MGLGFYQDYDQLIRMVCPDYDYCINLIAKNVPSKVTTILDLGSGTGNLALSILQFRPMIKVYGLEMQKALVDLANKKVVSPNVKFVSGDILKSEWPSSECITSSLVLHHFTQEQKEKVFRKIYRHSQFFLYYDRLKGSTEAEEKHNLKFLSNHMRKNGLPEHAVQEAKAEMEKNDNPLTAEELNHLIASLGFSYETLYLKNGFGVYSCTKKE